MRFIFLFLGLSVGLLAQKPLVELGVDRFFKEGYVQAIRGKKVGLVTNHTGVNSKMQSTITLIQELSPEVELVALFAPEHGIHGQAYAADSLPHQGKNKWGVPVYSLHGSTRRPSAAMLKGIDLLIYDIQDIGCRTYTYTTTLFYIMEEAAKRHIPVIVLDRPNPINGLTVDGPMLNAKWRSFIGYLNVPYCHGMTIGELATFFNAIYQVGCDLQVIKMKGWKRWMDYSATGLHWIPTSPQIPEPDSPLFYATTGILGELGIVNIGVGYTLPFKVVGAPWIQAELLADELNQQKISGVFFMPLHYRPFYGLYKGEDCQGVLIMVTSPQVYRPLLTQYMIMGILKNLYPNEVKKRLLEVTDQKKSLFCKANGNEEMLQLLKEEKYAAWKLILFQKADREAFLEERKKHLMYD